MHIESDNIRHRNVLRVPRFLYLLDLHLERHIFFSSLDHFDGEGCGLNPVLGMVETVASPLDAYLRFQISRVSDFASTDGHLLRKESAS